MEFLILLLCACAGGVFGWFVPTQVLAATSLFGIFLAIFFVGVGAGNPTNANVYFVLAGFCITLFIFGAWMTHAAH